MKEKDTSANPTSVRRDSFHHNLLSRRAFIKRTGAASVATFFVAHLASNSAEAAPVGDASHCPNCHGAGPCNWVSSMAVVFDQFIDPPKSPKQTGNPTGPGATPATQDDPTQDNPEMGPARTGKRWKGKLTVKYYDCSKKDAAGNFIEQTSTPIDVYTGGHKEGKAEDQNCNGPDTACPEGTFDMDNYVGDEETPMTCGNVKGFPVHDKGLSAASAHNGEIGGRENIEVHEEGAKEVSEGCIVFPKGANNKWSWFRSAARSFRCIHVNGKKNIGITVTYTTTPKPQGNTSSKA